MHGWGVGAGVINAYLTGYFSHGGCVVPQLGCKTTAVEDVVGSVHRSWGD